MHIIVCASDFLHDRLHTTERSIEYVVNQIGAGAEETKGENVGSRGFKTTYTPTHTYIGANIDFQLCYS